MRKRQLQATPGAPSPSAETRAGWAPPSWAFQSFSKQQCLTHRRREFSWGNASMYVAKGKVQQASLRRLLGLKYSELLVFSNSA